MTNNPTIIRAGAFVVAATAWFALGLQLLIMLEDYAAKGEGAAAAVWRFVSFFTILTNLVVAIVMTGKVVGGRFALSHSVVTGAAMNIAIVGLVYHFLLAPTWNPEGWQLVADTALHYGTPITMIAFWLVLEPKGGLTWRHGLAWLAYPLAYLAYSLVRGSLDGFFPYFFFDPPKIGAMQATINAVGLLIVFTVMGMAFVFMDGMLTKKRA